MANESLTGSSTECAVAGSSLTGDVESTTTRTALAPTSREEDGTFEPDEPPPDNEEAGRAKGKTTG
jgi:hypothetical protein